VPSIDFGVFIAYLLPGVIALYGLALVVPQLRNALRTDAGHLGIGGALIVTIIALTAGRILSIGRAATVDVTFSAPLPLFDCADRPYLGGIPAVAPDYRQLFESGHREAFILAIANEQRPHQFCGNTVLAVILLVTCWLVSLPKERRRRPHGIGRGRRHRIGDRAIRRCAVVVLRLHACATAAVNGTEFSSVNALGKPCRPFAALR